MRKIFWKDPYQRKLETKVKSVFGNKILLEETIAFSFSGGQESDRATINGMPIQSSEIEGLFIYYTLDDGHGLKGGDSVQMEIDWPRRYKLMRLHFAAELILELVTKKYGFEKIGAHISEDKSRIDFITDQNIAFIFDDILKDYDQIIAHDLPIQKGYIDEKNQKRFWEIEGFSRVPCGGTHVKSTAEVGYVKLKRKNIGKGKERIEITLVEEDEPPK